MTFWTVARAAMLSTTMLAALAGTSQAKTLVYCSEGSPENFSPMLNTTGTTFDANAPIYDTLVRFKPGTTEIEPGLAEKWDVSADGTSYTFHLRQNAKWQSNKSFKPTRGVTADDVLFTFNRQWKDDNPFHKVGGGAYSYFGDMALPKLLASIDKVDDYTVEFKLTKPNAPFLADMAMDFASIMSAEYADTLLKAGKPEQIDQEPIGSGPYSLLQYQKDATIRYRAFDGYWGPKPPMDTLVFSITKEAAVRLAKLQANECQVMAYPNPADLQAIKGNGDLQLMQAPGLNVGYLAFNVTKKPLDDKRVRIAINEAIDKKAILDAVYQGSGTPAKNLIPPTMWSYNNDVQDYKYDPEDAKKLLAEAGLKDGFETDLWAMPVQRPYNPDARRIAELMQSDLAKVGIKARIVTYEWGEYRKRVQDGDHMMAQLGWTGDNGDPDNFFYTLASCAAARPGGGSSTKWCNEEFNALITKAAELSDQTERAKLYEKAQVVMHDQAPYFLIAHSVVFMPMRKNVTGYVMSPLGRHSFDHVDLK
ncbi:MAG: ABC transporter substrate-binding protein [Acetobacteraceae bacterium]|nr:ABC transporter substrate-binding protein [Acetobacteraceae bacterium]